LITDETALKITERIKKKKLDARVVCVPGPLQWDLKLEEGNGPIFTVISERS